MKIILIRDARIKHSAGETVEVTPAEANYLISTGSATAAVEPPKKKGTKK